MQGKRCPYIGGVGMDLVAVDTSDSGYVERGDIVELIGPLNTIDDFAAAAVSMSLKTRRERQTPWGSSDSEQRRGWLKDRVEGRRRPVSLLPKPLS